LEIEARCRIVLYFLFHREDEFLAHVLPYHIKPRKATARMRE
jgi:hypothetical protein